MENFEIISKLGSGGFSKVYKVRRIIDDKIYALKKVQLMNLSQKDKLNSINEIRILSSIKSKYIIGYKEAFINENDSTLCLVMEYADCGDLSKLIHEKKLKKEFFNEKDIFNIFIQLIKGLKTLHNMNICHRDIKTSNIFLFSNGIVKIGDLNVSKILSKNILCNTQTGTPFYAAPEVWNQKYYSLKSDMWSLGCVLYEIINLKKPFMADNVMNLYNKVIKGEFGKISNKYSDSLNLILENLINVDPEKRMTCDQLLKWDVLVNKIKFYNEKNDNKKDLIIIKIENEENKNDNKSNEEELLKSIEINKDIKNIENIRYFSEYLPKPNYIIQNKENSISINNENNLKESESLKEKIINSENKINITKRIFENPISKQAVIINSPEKKESIERNSNKFNSERKIIKDKKKSYFGLKSGDIKLLEILCKKKIYKNHGYKKELNFKIKIKNRGMSDNHKENFINNNNNNENLNKYENKEVQLEGKTQCFSPQNEIRFTIGNKLTSSDNYENKEIDKYMRKKISINKSKKLILPKINISCFKKTVINSINQNIFKGVC